MDEAAVLARIALGTVFAVAAAGKLTDLPGTRKAAVEIGAPAVAAPALAWLVPAAEIAVALALAFDTSARSGATAALVLLLCFSAAIARGLAAGRRPDCHCLGQLRAGPVGTGTLARNFALALLAGFVVVAEGR